MNSYNIIGAFFGLIIIILFFGNKPGEPHKLSFNFRSLIKNGSIYLFNKHIHHWLISLIILLITIPIQYKTNNFYISLLNGFLFIFMIHGLSYSDRFIF